MSKILSSILTFIKGFFLLNYTYDLPTEPAIPIENTIVHIGKRKLESMISKISYFPITDIRYGFKDYSIEKYNSPIIEDAIKKKGKSISFTKYSVTGFKELHTKEMNVVCTIFSIGLDGNLWRFQFKPFILYHSPTDEYDIKMMDFCIDLVNIATEAMSLNKMTQYELQIDTIYSMCELSNMEFSGKVAMYGNYGDSQIYGIDELLPKPEEKDEEAVIHAVMEEKPIDTVIQQDEDVMLVDVVRRSKPRSEIDKETREALENFNISVISKKTIGEMRDMEEMIETERLYENEDEVNVANEA